MSDYKADRLDSIPKRDHWIPVRHHFDIGAFGVNAYTPDDKGQVISDHTELMAKHEELYVVVSGHATFTVDGEEIDAPAGTLVFVGDPTSRRGAVSKDPGTTVLAVGAKPGEAYTVAPWEEQWQENMEAMGHYREGRFEEAAAVLRKALETYPDSAGIEYNLACFESKAGTDADTVATHLGRSIELYPGFRDFAREDSDFDPVKDDPKIRELLEVGT
ncbi:MAG TPA: tetratricopeptide repeat protein [Gaiellaceae bacterium]|nr:tetratricopeptide repeat protein [Gaiellaceae bacterium]